MARTTGRSGFKMKSSPAKNLGNFFGSIFSSGAVKGRQDAQRESNTGEYKGMTDFEKRRAEKKSRKAGESKFQADVRRKREGKRAERAETKRRKNDPLLEEIKDTSELQGPKNKSNTKATKDKKTPKSKLSGSSTDARKKQYDAKGWKYDDTIKGYNRDGSRKKFVVQTSVTENKKGVLTPNTTSFNTEKEQKDFIAKNKGSLPNAFGYKIDDEGNRIKKENKGKIGDPPPNVATKETGKKDTNLMAEILKPGFMHAVDIIGKPINKKSPYKKGLGSYAKKAKGSRGYTMKRNK